MVTELYVTKEKRDGYNSNPIFAFYADELLTERIDISKFNFTSDNIYKFTGKGSNWDHTRFYLSDRGESQIHATNDVTITSDGDDGYGGISSGESLILEFADTNRESIEINYFSNRTFSGEQVFPGLTGSFDVRSINVLPMKIFLSNSQVREGDKLITEFQGATDLSGKKVYWKIEGITGSKASDHLSTGEASGELFLDDRGNAEISHYFKVGYKDYFYEHQRDEYKFSIYSDSSYEQPLAKSVTVKPVDSSRVPYFTIRFGKRTQEGNEWVTPDDILYIEEGEDLLFTYRQVQFSRPYFEYDEYSIPFNEYIVDGSVRVMPAITPNIKSFRNAINHWHDRSSLWENPGIVSPHSGAKGWFSTRDNAYDLTDGEIFSLKFFDERSGSNLIEQKVLFIDQNTAPISLNLSTKSISQQVDANSVVAYLYTSDANKGDDFTYSLVTGNGGGDNSFFNIDDDKLRINESPDFETKPSYSIRLRTTDSGNLSLDQIFILTVKDAEETGINVVKSVIGNGKLRGTKGADQFRFEQFEKFGRKQADKIIGFNSSQGDTIGVFAEAFSSLEGAEEIRLISAQTKKQIKALSKTDYDFIYYEKKGRLFFNGNSEEKGWGNENEGGLFAILKGKPELSAEDLTLLA